LTFASTSKLNQQVNYFANLRNLLFLNDSFEMSTEPNQPVQYFQRFFDMVI